MKPAKSNVNQLSLSFPISALWWSKSAKNNLHAVADQVLWKLPWLLSLNGLSYPQKSNYRSLILWTVIQSPENLILLMKFLYIDDSVPAFGLGRQRSSESNPWGFSSWFSIFLVEQMIAFLGLLNEIRQRQRQAFLCPWEKKAAGNSHPAACLTLNLQKKRWWNKSI